MVAVDKKASICELQQAASDSWLGGYTYICIFTIPLACYVSALRLVGNIINVNHILGM